MSDHRQLPSPGDGIPERIAEAIRERTALEPVAGIVLGSGLSSAVDAVKAAARDGSVELAYGELPGFPPPSVPGHAGKLWIGEVGDRSLAVFQGRVHLYEGHGMPLASLTSRLSAQLGARTMVLTAATGGLDPSVPPGSLVVLRDHINLMGVNPLVGWRMPDGSPAFVDVPDVYEEGLAALALASARTRAGDGAASEGIYVALPGPSFETPAETRMLHVLGGSVVGMSLVPEAVAARALGMRVLGLAFVTNAAGVPVSHEEVLQASKAASDAIGRVLLDLVEAF
jgi:inosine/guanosine/xanthosine phosphorylase family protein